MRNWDTIEAFVEVVRCGSFSAAAKRLHVSASHISRLVSQLESQLGSTLLFRTTRRIRLSEAGEMYYQQCAPLLDALSSTEEHIRALQQEPTGCLRVTCATTFGERFIAPHLNDFMQQYPRLELDLHLTNREVDLIEEGYDLAVRMGSLKSSSLLARRLCDRTEYLCASRHYVEQHGVPHTLPELQKHVCLSGSRGFWLFHLDGQRKEIKVPHRWRSNSGPALLDAVLKGLGIAQLPDYYVAEHLKNGTLVPILPQYQYPFSGVWLVYPKARQQSPKLKQVCDFLIARLSTDSPTGTSYA